MTTINRIDVIQCSKGQLIGKIENYQNLGYFVEVQAMNFTKGDSFNYPNCTYVVNILKIDNEVKEE